MDSLTGLTFGLLLLGLLRVGLLRGANDLAGRDALPAAVLCNGLALLLWPFSAGGWTQLGNLLGDCKAWRQARFCFERARWLRPDWIEAWLGLGVAALVLEQSWDRAHACFLHAYILRRGQPENLPPAAIERVEGQTPEVMTAHQLLHHAEQLEWLVTKGCLSQAKLQQARDLRELALQNPIPPMSLPACWLAQPACQGELLLPVDTARIEQDFAASGSLLTWYDGLLRPDVLLALQDFCQDSTIWHHAYRNGYLGAHLDDGMTCPLLYQIADAIKASFPAIFAGTRLVYLWAFKCRQQAAGVALHHDSALINVNFWITPDLANLNPDTGGLCVYLKEPPLAWDLERYQIAPDAMQRFVADVEPICVPYRQNRVVIFNSRLFHATQAFDFAPGYLNQRINVTLLFGRQPLRYHPKLRLPEAP